MKILIADDDQLIRTMLTNVLHELGHDVVAAASGDEAVTLFGRERPDLVIVDLLMPRRSGLDTLHAVRATAGRRTPAVLLTAITDRSVRKLEGSEIADAYLEKPFSRRTVEKALARAVRVG